MKRRLSALAALIAALLLILPVYADEIDIDLEWYNKTAADPEDIPEQEEVDPAAEEKNGDPSAKDPEETVEASGGNVAGNAESLSRPVIALAAGLLALAVAMLIHSVIRNRREEKYEKEHMRL